MTVNFENRVAIVTGGGNGLGRAYSLRLAELGAKVVVNDLGGDTDGSGASSEAADNVVEEIRAMGGVAMADGGDVTVVSQVDAMVAKAIDAWGRVDVLINNAGILRDKSFANLEMKDFQKVLDVHLYGTVNCTKAVWQIMRDQNYGRLLFTSSSSGLYGNFGQSSYGAAKAGVLGLMNALHQEGGKYGIRVNTLAPMAATRLAQGILPEAVLDLMKPELVAPGVLYLVSENAPSRAILSAGAGCFSAVHVCETQGVFLGGGMISADDVEAHWEQIVNPAGQTPMDNAFKQSEKFVAMAAAALGVDVEFSA